MVNEGLKRVLAEVATGTGMPATFAPDIGDFSDDMLVWWKQILSNVRGCY